jgi:3-hydroxyisobutyrate dehydrogenase-like beta-hydroxyacid dehydrogenase
MKIGIAGTGRMGTAIALRLLEKGHEVTVWLPPAIRSSAC